MSYCSTVYEPRWTANLRLLEQDSVGAFTSRRTIEVGLAGVLEVANGISVYLNPTFAVAAVFRLFCDVFHA